MCFQIIFQIFRGNDNVYQKRKHMYFLYIDCGRSTFCFVVSFSTDYRHAFFPWVLFQRIPSRISIEQSCASVDAESSKQWKSHCKSDHFHFLCFSDNWDFWGNQTNMTLRSPFNVTHNGISVFFIRTTKSWHMEIQVSQESIWILIVSISQLLRVASTKLWGTLDRSKWAWHGVSAGP